MAHFQTGELYFDAKKTIFIGEPIVRAVRWESTQSFVWFSLEPASLLARNAHEYPNAKIGKRVYKVKIDESNFNSDKIKKFENDCIPITLDSTFTCEPDLTLERDESSKPLTDENFVYLSPNEIFARFDEYKNAPDPKIKRYWQNTEGLFAEMGYTKDKLEIAMREVLDKRH